MISTDQRVQSANNQLPSRNYRTSCRASQHIHNGLVRLLLPVTATHMPSGRRLGLVSADPGSSATIRCWLTPGGLLSSISDHSDEVDDVLEVDMPRAEPSVGDG
jgi:hypothetical protein